jgi:hypothetical protein
MISLFSAALHRTACSIAAGVMSLACGPQTSNGALLPQSHAVTPLRIAAATAIDVRTEFPAAASTGVPDGLELTPYTGPTTIRVDGTVISGKVVSSGLTIEAKNVVIKNSRIATDAWFGILSEQYAVTVQNCDINGLGKTDGSYAISAAGSFLNNNIYGFENGITPGSNSIVRGNYIHDLADTGHPDGIPLHGGQSNVLIENNTVIGIGNGDVYITNDFGSISNVTINHNYLGGDPVIGPPVFTVFVVGGKSGGGTISGISITDNYVEMGTYGYIEIDQASATASGNHEMPRPKAIPAGIIKGKNGAGDGDNNK